MKKLISTLCFLLVALSMAAQGVYIYQPTGRLCLKSAELDSIVPSAGNYIVYKSDGTTLSLSIAKVDSLVAFESENSKLLDIYNKNTEAAVNLDAAKNLSDVKTAIKEANAVGVKKYTISGDFDNLGIVKKGNTISNPFHDSNVEEIDMTNVTNFTELPDYAFSKVNTLKKITLPTTVTSLKNSFCRSTGLETIVADGVTTVGDYTFYKCTSLQSVSLAEAKTFGEHSFWGCTALDTISLPKATSFCSTTFRNCSALTHVEMAELKTMPNAAFANGCKNIAEVVFPKLTALPQNAFYKCEKLSSVSLPECTSIDYCALAHTAVTTLDLPLVESISTSAFSYCDSLTSINMPNLTTISNGAFSNCAKLTAASLPALTETSSRMFDGCENLASVDMPTLTKTSTFTFVNCSALASVNMPKIIEVGERTFSSCPSLTSVEFPLATTIGNEAFYSCTSLTSLILPSATTIGNFIFRYSALTELKLTAPGEIQLGTIDEFKGNPTAAMDLTLNVDKKDEVTVVDGYVGYNGSAGYVYTAKWRGYAFKSVSYEE